MFFKEAKILTLFKGTEILSNILKNLILEFIAKAFFFL